MALSGSNLTRLTPRTQTGDTRTLVVQQLKILQLFANVVLASPSLPPKSHSLQSTVYSPKCSLQRLQAAKVRHSALNRLKWARSRRRPTTVAPSGHSDTRTHSLRDCSHTHRQTLSRSVSLSLAALLGVKRLIRPACCWLEKISTQWQFISAHWANWSRLLVDFCSPASRLPVACQSPPSRPLPTVSAAHCEPAASFVCK